VVFGQPLAYAARRERTFALILSYLKYSRTSLAPQSYVLPLFPLSHDILNSASGSIVLVLSISHSDDVDIVLTLQPHRPSGSGVPDAHLCPTVTRACVQKHAQHHCVLHSREPLHRNSGGGHNQSKGNQQIWSHDRFTRFCSQYLQKIKQRFHCNLFLTLYTHRLGRWCHSGI